MRMSVDESFPILFEISEESYKSLCKVHSEGLDRDKMDDLLFRVVAQAKETSYKDYMNPSPKFEMESGYDTINPLESTAHTESFFDKILSKVKFEFR